MSSGESRLTLEQLLAADWDDPSVELDQFSGYVEVTPRSLSVLYLSDCLSHLRNWSTTRLRLAQAAKSAHLALHSALTDAVAGSAGLGAFKPELREKYLTFLEESRAREVEPPQDDFVMSFEKLLSQTLSSPLEWTRRKIILSVEEAEAIKRLTFIRHRIEHPRPISHFIEPTFIALTLPVAARLTLDLLDECSHHYLEGERDSVHETVRQICAHCAEIRTD